MQQDYWKDLINLLGREAVSLGETPEAAHLYLEIGDTYFKELKQQSEAKEAYLKGLALVSDHLPLLQATLDFAAAANDRTLFEDTVPMMEKALIDGLQKSKATKKEVFNFYLATGKIWKDTFHDNQQAIACFEKCRELDRTVAEPLLEIAPLHEMNKRWTELALMYHEWLDLNQDNEDQPVRRGIRIKLASILFYQLDKTSEALETFQPLLDKSPDDQHILLLTNRILTRMRRWDELANNLLSLSEITADESLRINYLLQRAEIFHLKCNNHQEAISTLNKTLEFAPSNRLALERLVALYKVTNQAEPMARTLEALLSQDIKNKKEDELTARALNLADVWLEDLNQKQRATEALEMAHAAVPTDLHVITALARLYHGQSNWQALRGMYEKELLATEEEAQKLTICYRLGELLETKLQDFDAAAQAYHQATTISANYLPAVHRLEQYYIKRQDWQSLIRVLQDEVSASDINKRTISLMCRIANLREEKLQDVEGAAVDFTKILEHDSKNMTAISSLGRLYAKLDNMQKLVEMNLKEADLCGDPQHAISLYYKSGTICQDHLNNIELAVMCFQNALSISPTYIPALQSLGRAYARQGNWGGLVAMFHRETQVTSDKRKRLHLFTRVAEIYLDKFDDKDQAEQALKQALELDATYLPAVRQLEKLYNERSNFEGLVSLYKNIIADDKTSDERTGHYSLKIAQILHIELSSSEASEPFYVTAIENGVQVNHCIAALDQIYSQSGRFSQLANLLKNVLKLIEDEDYLVGIFYRLGIIHVEYLEDIEEGLEHLLQAHKLGPRHLPLFWDLCTYLERQQKWQELGSLHIEQAGYVEDRESKQEHLKIAARFLEIEGDYSRAVSVVENILEKSPEDEAMLNFAASLYRQSSRLINLVNILKKLIETNCKPEQLHNYVLELAVTYHEHLDQRENAINVLEDQLDKHNHQNYFWLAYLERLYLEAEYWPKLTNLYPYIVAQLKDDQSLVVTQIRFGESLEHTKKFDEAIVQYKKALGYCENHPDVHRKLKDLFKSLEKWEELISLLESEVANNNNSEKVRAHSLWEIADLYESHLDDKDKAIEYCKKSLACDPNCLSSYETLGKIYLDNKDWHKYLDISSEELTHNQDHSRLAKVHYQRGRVYLFHLNDITGAVTELQKSNRAKPDDINILDDLAKAYAAQSNYDEAIDTWRRLISLMNVTEESDEAAKQRVSNVLNNMAKTAIDGKGDENQGIQLYEEALQLVPDFELALNKLDEIYQQRQDWNGLVGVYEKGIDALDQNKPEELEQKCNLMKRLALLYEEKLDRSVDATSLYNKLLRFNRDDYAAHLGLSRIFSKNKEYYPRALVELIYLIDHDGQNDSFNAQYFHEIARIQEELHHFDHLCRTFECMDYLEIIRPTDMELYRKYSARVPETFTGKADVNIIRRCLFHKYEHQPLETFYQEVFVDLSALAYSTVDNLGLNKKDRLKPKDSHKARVAVNSACEALGVGEVDVYLQPGLGKPFSVFGGKSTGVVFDEQWVRNWSESHLLFFAGKAVSLTIDNRFIGPDLGNQEFRELVELVLKFAEDPNSATDRLSGRKLEIIKQVKKSLSRKTKKWLENHSEDLSEKLAQTDFGKWLEGIEFTSNRAGLLLNGKLMDASLALRQADHNFADGKAWGYAVLRDMATYWLSDDSGNMRKALNTSIYST